MFLGPSFSSSPIPMPAFYEDLMMSPIPTYCYSPQQLYAPLHLLWRLIVLSSPWDSIFPSVLIVVFLFLVSTTLSDTLYTPLRRQVALLHEG